MATDEHARPAGRHVRELAATLVGDAGDDLAGEVARWMADSRRFRAFVESHHDKIRKKLRHAGDTEARRDVRAEILVARRILAHARTDLAYEPAGAREGGPDFVLRHRGEPPVGLEVTRPRGDMAALGGTIITKLRQLRAGQANILVVCGDTSVEAGAVGSIVTELRRRARSGDDDPFVRRGLGGAREFRRLLPRLSAIVAWSEAGGHSEHPAVAWPHPDARIRASDRLLRALVALLST